MLTAVLPVLLAIASAAAPAHAVERQLDELGTISIADQVTTEGDAGRRRVELQVRLSILAASQVTFSFATRDGTATAADGDYVPSSGEGTIRQGDSTATIVVQVNGDRRAEDDESFAVVVSDVAGALGATLAANVLIRDDDRQAVTIEVRDAQALEGNPAQSRLEFDLLVVPPAPSPLTVQFRLVGETATRGADWTGDDGTVVVGAGEQRASIVVAILDDQLDEPDETLRVVLIAASYGTITRASATGTIRDDDVAAPLHLSVGNVAALEGDLGQAVFEFVASLTAPVPQAVSFRWRTDDQTATGGEDYVANDAGATIPAGQTSVILPVAVLGDLDQEGDERFLVRLDDAVGAQVTGGPAFGTIRDDDAPATALVYVNDVAVSEGDLGATLVELELLLSEPVGRAVPVRYETRDGTATGADGDYVASAGNLVFNPGEVRRVLILRVLGDQRSEGDEEFTVNLTRVNGAAIGDGTGVVVIRDDDAGLPRASVDDVVVSEGSRAVARFVLRLSSAAAPGSRVSFATDPGTAVAGEDFVSRSGIVEFASGQLAATVEIEVTNDDRNEPDEVFYLRLGAPQGVALGDGEGTALVLDDDQAPEPARISINDAEVAEGGADETPALRFVVALAAPAPGSVTVDYQTVAGTAGEGTDFRGASGTVVFARGERSREVPVFVLGDAVAEPAETLSVLLERPTGGSLLRAAASGLILDDDQAQAGESRRLSIGDGTVQEGDDGETRVELLVSLSQAHGETVRVEFATRDGSARAGSDYVALTGGLVFPPGSTSQGIAMRIRGDRSDEPDEEFFVELASPSGAVLGRAQARVLVLDDDDPATTSEPTLSVADAAAREGDPGDGEVAAVFAVTLDPPAADTVAVSYRSEAGSARAHADFLPTSGTLLFRAGEASKQVAVTVVADDEAENDEAFSLVIDQPQNAGIGRGRATGRIGDDDRGELPVVELLEARQVSENAGVAEVIVRLLSPGADLVAVLVEATGDTATAGEDFSPTSQVVEFAPGLAGARAVRVPVLDDHRVEGDERFQVVARNRTTTAAQLGRAVTVVVVIDDDRASRLLADDLELEARTSSELELVARVLDDGGRAIAGAAVAWTASGGATLSSGEVTESDEQGAVRQTIALGPQPGTVTVDARLVGGDAALRFTITVAGDLVDLFDPEQQPNQSSFAGALDRACRQADRELAQGCDYLFRLDESSRRAAVEALVPDGLAGQARAISDAGRLQASNVSERLQALRAGGALALGQLVVEVQGHASSIDQVRSSVRAAASPLGPAVLARGVDRALARLRPDDGSAPPQTAAQAPRQDPSVSGLDRRLGVFVNGRLTFGEHERTTAEPGYDFETRGLTAGVDYKISPRLFVGAALGYSDSTTDLERARGGADTTGFALTLYGGWAPSFSGARDRLFVEGQLVAGRSELELVRRVDLPEPFQGASRLLLRADTEADSFGGTLGASYDFRPGAGAVRLSGFSRLSRTSTDIDPFAERGGGPFALAIGGQRVRSLLVESGIDFGVAVPRGWGVLQPVARLSWFAELEDQRRGISGGFVLDTSGQRFVLFTDDPDTSYLNGALGLTFTFERGRSAFVLFDVDLLRDDLDQGTISFGYRQQL